MSVARNDGMKGEPDSDPYLNYEQILYSTDWNPGMANDDRSNWDGIYGGDNESGYVRVEIQRPEDYLIEIQGVQVSVGDPGAAGQWDLWVYDDWLGEIGSNWYAREGEHGEYLFFHASGASAPGHNNTNVNLEKPILSDGRLEAHVTSNPTEAGGELGARLFYTYREADEQEILRQLLQSR